jgi:uncharacterized protein involved in tellurium resistance
VKKTVVLVLSVLLLAIGGIGAFAATESGYLYGPGAAYSFTVNAGNVKNLDVTFNWPRGSTDFWVKVVGQDGRTVLGNFDLDNGEIINLSGGGIFYLTIYSNRGAGNWSATYALSGGGGPGPAGSCNVDSRSASGHLVGPGDSCNWSIYANSNYLEVPFNYPKGSADFWVDVVGQDGRTLLGKFDLDNGAIIQLSGGGMFYLTIYSNRGAGNWSCTW